MFGVLYSVYAQYQANLKGPDLRRPPILDTLIILCRWVKRLIWSTAGLAVVGFLISFIHRQAAEWLLTTGLIALMFALGFISSQLVKKMGRPVGEGHDR